MFANGSFVARLQILLAVICIIFGTRALSAQEQLSPENELLLELRLDGDRVGMDILGYQRGDEFLLSLDELANGLGFLIDVDADNGLANGWYITEGRVFSLDLTRSEVVSEGKSWQIVKGEVVVIGGDLYVDTKALERWFPLRLTAVIRELYLDVVPSEELPIQKRLNRKERVVNHTSGYREPQYPLQETPYQLFSPHINKLRLGYSTFRQTPDSEAEYGVNYASLSRGDLLWMTSTLSFAGQSGNSLTGARIKLERTAFDGPLGLNHVEIGDVDVGGFRGLLLRGGGRGGIGGRFDSESVSLEGSQLPDWDVELYQNGQLIMILTTGPDGRYLFEDVDLLFGENRFEIRFFGPNGEMESREEFYFLGEGMLDTGKISYKMSAAQSGRTVFGVNDSDGAGDRDSAIYTGDFNLGLSRHMTVGAGITSLEKNQERVDTYNVGFAFSSSRLFGNVSYVDAPDAQNSASTSLRTRLGNTNVNVGFTRFFNDSSLISSPQKWASSADITSSIVSVPIRLEFNTQEQENRTQQSAIAGTTRSLPGSGRLSSSIWYSSVEERSDGNIIRSAQSGGQSSFHTVIQPWSLRFSSSYSFQPVRELLEYSVYGRVRIEKDLTLDLNVRQNPTTDTTHYGAGINWQLDQVAINARVNYDSDERWGGLITLSTVLVHQPGTLRPILDSRATVSAGSVEVRVYDDSDGGMGAPHAGVGVNGVQTWRNATTDSRGVAYLSQVPAHRQIDIELDESTLSDYELKSKVPGVSIIARPGSFAVVEFPIVRTAELEGHVHVARGEDKNPLSRALIRLKTLDGELVAQTRSAYDGFFLFEGIQSGKYQLSLEEHLSQRLIDRPQQVTVSSSSDVIRGLDFTLHAAQTKSIVVNTLGQEQASSQSSITTPSPPVTPPVTPPVLGFVGSAEPDVESRKKQVVDELMWFVQLGAYGSKELAQAFWDRTSPVIQMLADKTPRFVPYRNMIRLLVGPGRDRVDADKLCQQLKSEQLDCLVRQME